MKLYVVCSRTIMNDVTVALGIQKCAFHPLTHVHTHMYGWQLLGTFILYTHTHSLTNV